MSFFPVKNKVALITGGFSELGIDLAKELLKNGAKGVSLVDFNEDQELIIDELENIFGKNKVIIVKANIKDMKQFEYSFVKTLETYKTIDILINNSDVLGIPGTINGIILASNKYLKSNKQATIVNLSTINENQDGSLYASTKFAIHGLTQAWSDHKSNVKIIAICPEQPYEENKMIGSNNLTFKTKEYATEVIRIIEHAQTGSVWIVENDKRPYEFILPDRFKITEKTYSKPENYTL